MKPVVLTISGGTLRVLPWADDQVRVTFTARSEFLPTTSPLVVADSFQDPVFDVEETDTRVTIRLAALVVEVDRRSGSLRYLSPDGRLLLAEAPRDAKILDPFPVVHYDYETLEGPAFEFGADGFKVRTPRGTPRVDRQAWHAKLALTFADDEALYGLGSHEEGVLNLRGTVQYLYQQNRKIAIPYLVSTRGWAMLWNTGSSLTFRDDQFGSSVWMDCVEELDYWLTASPRMPVLAGALLRLTGQAPLLPRWAFGYFQSKERYKTQDEILETAREFRRRGLPLHCVVLDWMSWPEGLWGQKSLDPERFPDPAGMIRELHQMDVKFMVSIWPILRAGGTDHREFAQRGLLLGNGGNYNAFDPAARDLYWEQAERGLFQYGVDAWWCDCTEPFEADWHGAVQPEPEDRRQINLDEFRKYLDPAVANLYSSAHCEGIYTHQRAKTAERRVVNLTRSSYPGQQRWSTIAWSGDFSATWEEFRRQIPAALNFFATGMPWWTFDIGAFFVKRDPNQWFWAGDYPGGAADPEYRELYLRMLQFGAFLPCFRAHGTDTPREPWQFGDVGDPIYDSIVDCLKWRVRWIPWLYSHAADVTWHQQGLVRPLVFDYPGDPATHQVKDQFLVGDGLMVCPVTQPRSQAGATRSVYLPQGQWYDFWTGQALAGPAVIPCAAGLDHIPLFVRAGTLLVFGDPDEIRVYPGADGALDWYDDAGDGYGYEHGEFSRTPMRWNDAPRVLSVGAARGRFPGMRTDRTWMVTGPDGSRLEASVVGPAGTNQY